MDLETLAFLVIFIGWILRAILSPIAERRKQQKELEEAVRQPQTQPQQPVRQEQQPPRQQHSRPAVQSEPEPAQPVRKTAVELLRELGLDLEATVQEEPREARSQEAGARDSESWERQSRQEQPREWRSNAGDSKPDWLPPPPLPTAPPVQQAPPVQRPSARRDRAKAPPPQASQPLPPIPEMGDEGIQAPIELPKVRHTAADAATAHLRSALLADLRGGPVGLRRAVLLTEILGPAPGLRPARELGRGTVSPTAGS